MGLFYMKKFDQYVRHLQVLCRAEQEDVWLEMLRDRNDATHIYNEEAAQQLVEKILHQYIECLSRWNSRSVPGMEMRC